MTTACAALRITERYHRRDAEHMDYPMTIDDAKEPLLPCLERNSQQKFRLVLITLKQPIRQEVLGSPACIPNLRRNVEKQGMDIEPEADHHSRGRVVVELGLDSKWLSSW
jgi:hypothetical protein